MQSLERAPRPERPVDPAPPGHGRRGDATQPAGGGARAPVSDQLRQDYQKARMAEEVEAGDVEVVDMAAVPDRAALDDGHDQVRRSACCSASSSVAVWRFLLESLNTSIRRPEDIEAALHLPGLAVIPRLTPATPKRRLGGLLKGDKSRSTREPPRSAPRPSRSPSAPRRSGCCAPASSGRMAPIS